MHFLLSLIEDIHFVVVFLDNSFVGSSSQEHPQVKKSISVPSQAAVSSILGNTEGFFVNRAIFGDLIQTLLESARFGKDADMLVPSLMSILQFLRHSFDIDVVKGILNLVLFHNSVLSIIEEDDELCQLTRHVLKQLEGSDQLPVELKEVCQDLAKSLCIG